MIVKIPPLLGIESEQKKDITSHTLLLSFDIGWYSLRTQNCDLEAFQAFSASPHCHPSAVNHDCQPNKGQFLLSLKAKMLKSFSLSFLLPLQIILFQWLKHISVTTAQDTKGDYFRLSRKLKLCYSGTCRKSVLPHQRPWKQHACPKLERRWGCEGWLSLTRRPW